MRGICTETKERESEDAVGFDLVIPVQAGIQSFMRDVSHTPFHQAAEPAQEDRGAVLRLWMWREWT